MKLSNNSIIGLGAILLICTLFVIPVSAADEAAAASESADAEYWLNIVGYSYLKEGQYELAIEAFDKAIELDPDLAAAHHNKGVCLYNLGEYDKALEEFRMAISNKIWFANPYSRGYLWEYTGKTLDGLKRYEEAIPAYEESLRNTPLKAEIWVLLVQDLQVTGDFANSSWIQNNVFIIYDNGTVGADQDKGFEYLSLRPIHNTSDYYGEVPSGQAAPLTSSIIALIAIIVVAAAGGAYLQARKNK